MRQGMVALAVVALALSSARRDAAAAPAEALPADWQATWRHPAAADRPLQIVHGIDPQLVVPHDAGQAAPTPDATQADDSTLRYYLSRGLGGLVCNVAFDDYLRSEQHWATLAAGVEQCAKLGLIVWLYDEQGYPSGAAGGLVIGQDPTFEAIELALDPARADPFLLRPAYEHTHAANNYYAARRFPNLIDDRAVRCFLEQTHEAYWRRLRPYFGTTIQAFFTDEPSLMAVNLGPIPAPARDRVPVVDPVDLSVPALPSVPWCNDLPAQYRKRYGQDLLACRGSLFAGDAAEDRRVRQRFWALIADLIAARYFGAVQTWCAEHGVAASGHSLWEEHPLHHVALHGNALKVLARMDIPGLDMLSTDPETVSHAGWLTAALPVSAARLGGRRRVMTEVSDFSQTMAGTGPAGLAAMQATAAWQAAWGVTDFTLYYSPANRSVADYRAYCDYVGRLNSILRPATPMSDVLLYYPIYDLWAEYLPVARPLRLETQSPRAQRIVQSFIELGQSLQRNQIPFTLVDHEYLATGTVQPGARLAIGKQTYGAVVLPESVELPPPAASVVAALGRAGGQVVAGPRPADRAPSSIFHPRFRIIPPSEKIALGQFARAGRDILLLVNVGQEPWAGQLAGDVAGHWSVLDPASATAQHRVAGPADQVALTLAPRQAQLLIREKPG